MRDQAMDALVALIGDLRQARAAADTGKGYQEALRFQRHAQFYLDFVEAENSTGFHAPQEALRILGQSIDLARRGQLAIRPLVAAHAVRR
jgi:nitrite reductase (cytochrome c-552)